jgi:hypothetical protein
MIEAADLMIDLDFLGEAVEGACLAEATATYPTGFTGEVNRDVVLREQELRRRDTVSIDRTTGLITAIIQGENNESGLVRVPRLLVVGPDSVTLNEAVDTTMGTPEPIVFVDDKPFKRTVFSLNPRGIAIVSGDHDRLKLRSIPASDIVGLDSCGQERRTFELQRSIIGATTIFEAIAVGDQRVPLGPNRPLFL